MIRSNHEGVGRMEVLYTIHMPQRICIANQRAMNNTFQLLRISNIVGVALDMVLQRVLSRKGGDVNYPAL